MQDPKEPTASSTSESDAVKSTQKTADKSSDSQPTTSSQKAVSAAKVDKKAQSKTKQTPAKKSSKSLWILLLLILILGVGAYGVWQYQLIKQQLNTAKQQQISSTQQLQEQQTTLQAMQEAQAKQKADVQSLVSTWQKELAVTQEHSKQLASQLQQLQNHTTFVDSQVNVKEVENLLVKANQRLLTERNPALAIPFIHAAQDLIKQAKVLGSFELLEAIAIDLVALESVAYLDAEDTYLRLSGLINQTDKLRLGAVSRRTPNQAANVAHEPANGLTSNQTSQAQENLEPIDTPSNWFARLWLTVKQSSTQTLSTIGQELRSLIIIRQRNEADQPQLSIEQESWQRIHLQQFLVQAQTALLQQQQGIYDDALLQAQKILTSYGASNAKADYMRQEIASLQAVKLVTQVPKLKASLEAVATWQANLTDIKQNKE